MFSDNQIVVFFYQPYLTKQINKIAWFFYADANSHKLKLIFSSAWLKMGGASLVMEP